MPFFSTVKKKKTCKNSLQSLLVKSYIHLTTGLLITLVSLESAPRHPTVPAPMTPETRVTLSENKQCFAKLSSFFSFYLNPEVRTNERLINFSLFITSARLACLKFLFFFFFKLRPCPVGRYPRRRALPTTHTRLHIDCVRVCTHTLATRVIIFFSIPTQRTPAVTYPRLFVWSQKKSPMSTFEFDRLSCARGNYYGILLS